MSKNCEIKKYIEKLPLSQTEKERLNNIHNAIGKSAIESKAFRLYEGRIYARKFSYNKAVQFVSSINKQYNTTIAKLVQSLPNQHTLSVNVTSLSKEIQGKLFASTDTLPSNQIQYTLKAINALEDSKVREPNKNFQGFLNDLRNVPKDQLELIKNTYVEGMSKEDLIASLIANYSYTVEINTAKGLGDTFSLNNRYYLESFEDEISYYADIEGTEIITENVIKYRILNPNGAEAFEFENKIDAEKKLEELNSNLPNSNIYNNLTVPGGTNYTENEISIPGQLVEEKPQGVPAKEGVPELFESNPELANAVYEALGFSSKLKTSLGKQLDYKDHYVSESRLKDFKKYEVLDENGKNIGTVIIEYRTDKSVILHPELNITGKGYGRDLYKLISSKFNVEIQEWNEGAISNSDSAKAMWNSLEKEGIAKRVINDEQGDNFRTLKYSNQLTPQQKQQAQELYSQYLDTIFPDYINNFAYEAVEEFLVANKIIDRKC